MTRIRPIVAGSLVFGLLALPACRNVSPNGPGAQPLARAEASRARAARTVETLERQHLQWPDDRARMLEAATRAWNFIDQSSVRETGFVMGDKDYPYATIWDVGSMLAALYAAQGLGLLSPHAYETRAGALLDTLLRLPLTHHGVFNKAYDMRDGTRSRVSFGSADDAGWSSTDFGRLLVWLKIAGTTPALAQKAAAVVKRNDFASIVQDGYLIGETIDRDGREERYKEGVLGYEQYAARGFALWGYPVTHAMRLSENALPITVMGQPLVADYRRWDRLTNEPFLLWGLEIGWDPQTALLARRMLRAQELRYRKTGMLTITGEDALRDPPYYFYYYCIFAGGMDFAVDVQDHSAVVEGPRWISTKSTFAFHALMPTAYTETALRALDAAQTKTGWASGVYERTGTGTGQVSVNTAAVILEAALVSLHGGPLLSQGASD